MRSRLLVVSDCLYRALLQLYPADFQHRFALEMAQVFRNLCDTTYQQSGRGGVMRLWLPALLDQVGAAFYQWRQRLFKGRMERMKLNLIDRRDGIQPLSAVQAGLATLPFLAFGLSSMLSKLEFFQAHLVSLPLWQILLTHPYLVFDWLILLGLGAGLLAGFPRWTFSYLGWALLFAGWWSDMGFYGHTLDWKIWLPLVGVLIIPLLIRRSLAPLRTLFSGMWREWTLLALGVYIMYAWLYLSADVSHHPYLLTLIALIALGLSAGAWGYFRAASPLRRALALVAGLLTMIMVGIIGEATRSSGIDRSLPDLAHNISLVGVILFTSSILLVLATGLLALWRRWRSSSL